MNVIVFSKRHGRARQIELGRPLALTVTIAAVLAVLWPACCSPACSSAAAASLNDPRPAGGASGARKLEEQRAQVLDARGASCRIASMRSPAASAR